MKPKILLVRPGPRAQARTVKVLVEAKDYPSCVGFDWFMTEKGEVSTWGAFGNALNLGAYLLTDYSTTAKRRWEFQDGDAFNFTRENLVPLPRRKNVPKKEKPAPAIVCVHEFEGGSGDFAFYSLGYLNVWEWTRLFQEWWAAERAGEVCKWDPTLARHLLMRFVPIQGPDGGQQVIQCPAKAGKGAFPVTYMEEWSEAMRLPDTDPRSILYGMKMGADWGILPDRTFEVMVKRAE